MNLARYSPPEFEFTDGSRTIRWQFWQGYLDGPWGVQFTSDCGQVPYCHGQPMFHWRDHWKTESLQRGLRESFWRGCYAALLHFGIDNDPLAHQIHEQFVAWVESITK